MIGEDKPGQHKAHGFAASEPLIHNRLPVVAETNLRNLHHTTKIPFLAPKSTVQRRHTQRTSGIESESSRSRGLTAGCPSPAGREALLQDVGVAIHGGSELEPGATWPANVRGTPTPGSGQNSVDVDAQTSIKQDTIPMQTYPINSIIGHIHGLLSVASGRETDIKSGLTAQYDVYFGLGKHSFWEFVRSVRTTLEVGLGDLEHSCVPVPSVSQQTPLPLKSH
ncbi:hypothetical protein EJ05DRAFT_505530 [Pseudovirgaria hyperparasitica]|uniref:Uncharacterized protein n=1 Tax=Pseudovirgaria hyperparasitica TaxID=470096 RepID=A0A6A6VT66_9PEZI|nr:uncharacterized protein EJ05DRAFT_505530 [Pseudovirgaria hyperparasitica]KAF2752976.1 hypothetical protein EJ05DRAFT_505530 [Pseudovirgaria hyperparasitica]